MGSEEVSQVLLQRALEKGYSVEFLAVTGSHSWGLSTEDSDIDLRGVFGKPTRQVLSLDPGRDTWQGSEMLLDWQLYEVKKTLHMLCAANGNVVQMFYNPLVVKVSGWGQALRSLAESCLTKRLAKYFLGYATSQRKRAMQNRGGKALIYTYREAYAGIYLMAEERIVFDFNHLRSLIEGKWHTSEVLPWALENRKTPTPPHVMKLFGEEWIELQDILIAEASQSRLPEREPDDFRTRCDDHLTLYRWVKWLKQVVEGEPKSE